MHILCLKVQDVPTRLVEQGNHIKANKRKFKIQLFFCYLKVEEIMICEHQKHTQNLECFLQVFFILFVLLCFPSMFGVKQFGRGFKNSGLK